MIIEEFSVDKLEFGITPYGFHFLLFRCFVNLRREGREIVGSEKAKIKERKKKNMCLPKMSFLVAIYKHL